MNFAALGKAPAHRCAADLCAALQSFISILMHQFRNLTMRLHDIKIEWLVAVAQF